MRIKNPEIGKNITDETGENSQAKNKIEKTREQSVKEMEGKKGGNNNKLII